LKEIERQIRAHIPHIYLLFCIPELTYLANSGLMDRVQALAGEMLDILPIFHLEEGRLVPMEKVRTPRHLFEAFMNFLSEFETPTYISLLNSSRSGNFRSGPMRQFVKDTFPETAFSEGPISTHLAALFGPSCIGLFIMEMEK